MKYYQVFTDLDQPSHWSLGKPVISGTGSVWQFSQGGTLDASPLGKIVFPVKARGRDGEIVVSPFDVVVAIGRSADVIRQAAPNDVQFVPAELDDGTAVLIINILNVIDCFDFDRSGFTRFPADYWQVDKRGKPNMVLNLRIRKEMVGSQQVFRVMHWEGAIVCSEGLLAALAAADVTGLRAMQEV
jgi:uncharacterized protein DUF1629